MALNGRPTVEQLAERYTVESGIIEREPAHGLPAHAFPGGYPFVYVDEYHNELCPDCASELVRELASETCKYAQLLATKVAMWHLHLEGDSVYCTECNAEIASAYGPLDEDN